MKSSQAKTIELAGGHAARRNVGKLNVEVVTTQARTVNEASLVFDSYRQKTSIASRGSASGPRQLLYQYGNLSLDMQLQPKPRSNSVLLVGQVMDSQRPVQGLGAIPVSLLDDEQAIYETTTNNFGEFNMSFESKDDLRVFLDMKDALVVSLPNSQTD